MTEFFKLLGRIARFFTLTEGERSILLACVSVAIFGGIMAFNILLTFGGQAAMTHLLSAYELWVVMAGGVGGVSGLYLSCDWMGKPGLCGFVCALAALLGLTFTGAIVAGSLALPFYGTMFGPFALVMSLIGAPALAALWCSTVLGAHFLMVIWRAERAAAIDAVMPAAQA